MYLGDPSAAPITSTAGVFAFVELITLPIVLVWLIALVVQRGDPMLDHRLEVAQGVQKVIAPIDSAETRVAKLSKNILKQLSHIDSAADVATDRLKNLEDRFQNQIESLMGATADTDVNAAKITERLKKEREALKKVAAGLQEANADPQWQCRRLP